MLNVGVIGYGYWGPNLVRNFMEAPGAQVKMICDANPAQLSRASKRYPGIHLTPNAGGLINSPQIDAVVICTPVNTHYQLALAALQAGKHVLVEKPMTTTAQESEHLIEEAARRDRVLMVDHTFVYTSAVRKIADLVHTGELGDLLYYDSTRINLGLFQRDVNVVWDLGVHDLSIIEYIFQREPRAISATGTSHVPGQPENVAFLTLYFDESLIAHVNVNWLAPVKVRRTLIGGSKKMVVYDALEPIETVKVYDKGIDVDEQTSDEAVYRMLIGYRTGDMYSPKLDTTEALQIEAQHFIECINGRQTPITDGAAGLRVVKMLEAATQSLQQRGGLVTL